MTALLDLHSPTALDVRKPECREWDACADYYEGPFGDSRCSVANSRAALRDEKIHALVARDDDESTGAAMGRIQRALRLNDRQLVLRLIAVIRDRAIEPSTRALVLETLAGARVRAFDSEVLDVIREAVESRDAELQFAAVAAASDLSRRSQVLLGGVIRQLVENGMDYWVRRAATTFISSL